MYICICQNYETESLQWLSSQQALADLVAFHVYFVKSEGLTGQEKWVTWGGKSLYFSGGALVRAALFLQSGSCCYVQQMAPTT